MARGGGQLQPEKSFNMSGGAVIEKGAFTFTADFFRVRIEDRVALSQEVALTEPEIETLLAEGIPEARNFPVFRFFLNDFATLTQGVDLISTYTAGNTTVSAVFNFTDTQLQDIQSSVIDRFRITTLEEGLPNTRWTISATHDARRWDLLARVNYFGKFWDSEDGRNAVGLPGGPDASWLYPAYAGRALVDIEFGVPIGPNVHLAVGGENIFNTYPEVNQFGAMTVGNMYGQFSPFGFNGANFYVRLNYGWGSGRPGGGAARAEARPDLDPLRKRQEVAEQIEKLDALHDELIDQLQANQADQTDPWLKRRAGDKLAMARMAKERVMQLLRSAFARRAVGDEIEPLGRSAEMKQLQVKGQISEANGPSAS